MAKNSLERYTHYYERWATNQSVWILSLYLVSFELVLSVLIEAAQILGRSVMECEQKGWVMSYVTLFAASFHFSSL